MASEKQAADFGAKLRAAREHRGLSLRAIADATRISVRALEALERNEIARLPGGIFSRSFVRAYATEVGLDPEQTIAEFITRFPDETVTQGHPRTRAIVDELDRDGRRRAWPTVAAIAVVAAAVLLLLAYFGLLGKRASGLRIEQVTAAATHRPRGSEAAAPAGSGLPVAVHAGSADGVMAER